MLTGICNKVLAGHGLFLTGPLHKATKQYSCICILTVYHCKWLKYFMIHLFLWFSESYCMNKFILPLFIWKPCNWQVQNNDQPTESLARQNINGHLGQKIVCWLESIVCESKPPMVLPFKWNIFSSTFRRCYMFYSILQNEIWRLLVVEGFK